MAAALTLAALTVHAGQIPDACAGLVPTALQSALSQKYPAYRLPRQSDNLDEDVERNRKRGGSGCLGVAAADMNGDRKKDYVLVLSPLKGEQGLVIIALSGKNSWTLQELSAGIADARRRQYVEAVNPGKYQRTEALDANASGDEMASMICTNSGVIVGASESTGVVHCYIEGKVRHVWASD